MERAATSKNLQRVLVYFSFVDKMPDGTVFIVFSFIIQIFCGIGGALAMTAAIAFLAQCFADNIASVMVSKMLPNELLYHIALAAGILWTNKETIIIDILNIHIASHCGNYELGQETRSQKGSRNMRMIDFLRFY